MISSKTVRQTLLAHQPSTAPTAGEAWGLLFGLLTSLLATALLTAAGVFFLAPGRFHPQPLAATIVLAWGVCAMLGYLIKDTMGLADPFYAQAEKAQNSFFRRDQADDWMAAGCLVAILQFCCGSLWVCTSSLLRLAFRPEPTLPELAAPLLTVMVNQSDRSFGISELQGLLEQAGVESHPAQLQGTLDWLAQGGWVIASGTAYQALGHHFGV